MKILKDKIKKIEDTEKKIEVIKQIVGRQGDITIRNVLNDHRITVDENLRDDINKLLEHMIREQEADIENDRQFIKMVEKLVSLGDAKGEPHE